ncbi:MAG: VOC family protein [Planctomycetota bacterium]|jgi:predicted enzyme related to lactoylglutathione lyase
MNLPEAIQEAHPVYYVSDLKATEAFYTERLGLEKAWEFGTNILGIRVLPGFLLVFCEDRAKVQSGSTSVMVFAVRELDAIYSGLKSKGVAFSSPPEDTPVGRIASFSDPDGYKFDLCG